MERRNSDDGRTPQQPANPNVFDDEFALDPDEDDFMPAVSDGFRPTNAREGWDRDRQDRDRQDRDRQDRDRNDVQRPPITTTKPTDSDLRRMATRNSTTKTRDSLSHERRTPGNHNRGPSTQVTGSPHRESTSSTGSFATMARSESPFGAAPSHPYGMYPQNTMARSSSIATTSTQRQPHRSVSLQRPQHPYAMYSQTVVEDEPPVVPPIQTSIPVGFPGLNGGYHRQIGPDGEEQDIIGPDGHTEQLPPYSRYPEEGPTKAAMAAEASATPVEPMPSPLSSPSDPLLAPVSPITAHLPPSRPETQNREMPLANTRTVTTTTSLPEQDISEKYEPVGKAKNWRSKKLWGKIPMSVALILLVLVLIFAIILGAAIGTFVAKGKDKPDKPKDNNNKNDPEPQVTGPSSLFDATPIPVPSSLPSLPAGNFSLPLGIAQESSPGCLRQPNQLSAWSCKMTFAPLKLTINNTVVDGTPRPWAKLEALTKPDGGIQYGLQPPSTTIVKPMQLVLDLDYKAYGPAYHFSDYYDKIVILKPDEFAAGASLRKRQEEPPQFRHRFQVMPGDEPWYCFWNGTYIEGYVYVEDNSTAASFTNFPTPWPTNPYGSSIPVETAPPPTVVNTPQVNPTQPTPSPSSTPLQRRGDSDIPRLPPYPRIVKIEERRLPGSTQPYCQKMLLLDNGQLTESPSTNGGPIKVYLQEEDPSFDDFFEEDQGGSPTQGSSNQKRGDPSDACHCQWMFQ